MLRLSHTAQLLWRHHRHLLAVLWLLVQGAFVLRYHGPHFVNDSARYLLYAQGIAERGYFEPGHNLRYVLYPLYQSLWLWLGLGRWGIAAGQVALAGLAARGLYRGTQRLAGGGRAAAALATALFILWPEVQQFNLYLLTESLFISLTVLSFAAFTRLRGGGRPTDWVRLLALLLLTALARPNGFVVALAAALACLDALRRQRDRRPWKAALLLLALAAPLLWQALNHQLETFTLLQTYQRGDLMFLSPEWAVHSSTPLALPPADAGPVARVLFFAVHNPGFFGRLALGKLVVFVSGLKPHYSLLHRLANVAVLWPAYWLAVRGAAWRGVWRPGRVLLAGIFLLQTLVVMFTVDDWDVRFLAPVLPCVFVLAAVGVSEFAVGTAASAGRRRWPPFSA